MTDQVTVSRELLRQVLDALCASMEFDAGDAESEVFHAAAALREALEQPAFATRTAVEPVCYQYQARDSSWHHFMNEKHYADTVADGSWPIRALYTAPQAQQPAVEPVGWYWEYNGIPEGQVFFGKGPDADVIKRGLVAEFPRVVRYVYAAPQAQQSIGWLRAIDEEMVSTHLGIANITDSYEEAKKKLNNLICWHIDVSHDPKVNGSAQQPADVPECNPHPKAPHGFDRNASHSADRYVCECESWEPYQAGYDAGFQAGMKAEQALCAMSDLTQEMESKK